MVVAVAGLFLGPLWATGELGVWAFTDPRSHLLWDEAAAGPGTQHAPRPADSPGGAAMLEAELAAPILLAVVAASVGALRRRA